MFAWHGEIRVIRSRLGLWWEGFKIRRLIADDPYDDCEEDFYAPATHTPGHDDALPANPWENAHRGASPGQ